MTGFGAVTQEVTAQPAATPAPAVAAPEVAAPEANPVTPGVVSAFEGSIDDRLNALLNT